MTTREGVLKKIEEEEALGLVTEELLIHNEVGIPVQAAVEAVEEAGNMRKTNPVSQVSS